jgi:hypothetical protein
MKKISIIILGLSAVFLMGCQKISQSVANTATVANTTTNATPKTGASTPATEKTSNDFVESESGTEKDKPASGKANVQGKVLYNEKPVEGIEVKLCSTFSQYIGGCGGETFTTKTDANGEYFFANVTPKIYEGLLVRVFTTKSYVFATKGFGIASAKYKIDTDKTFFAPETNLFKSDLKVQNPKSNAKADAKAVEIKWDVYPDAAYYKLNLSPKEYNYDSSISSDKIEGTSYKVEKALVNGEYSLKVTAYSVNDVKLADSGDYIKFNIIGGTDAPKGSGETLNSNSK